MVDFAPLRGFAVPATEGLHILTGRGRCYKVWIGVGDSCAVRHHGIVGCCAGFLAPVHFVWLGDVGVGLGMTAMAWALGGCTK